MHRAVLAARSRFFRKALRRQWRTKVHCWSASFCMSRTLSCSRWQTACEAMLGSVQLDPERHLACVSAATGPCNLCIISALRATFGDVARGPVQRPYSRCRHATLCCSLVPGTALLLHLQGGACRVVHLGRKGLTAASLKAALIYCYTGQTAAHTLNICSAPTMHVAVCIPLPLRELHPGAVPWQSPCPLHSNPSSDHALPLIHVYSIHVPNAPGVWKHGATHNIPATCPVCARGSATRQVPALLQRGWMSSGMTCLPCCV